MVRGRHDALLRGVLAGGNLQNFATRRTEGKSLLFLTLVLIGYLAGILAKFVTAIEQWTWPNWVTILYAINAGMVAFDMYLYHRFRPRQKPDLGEPTLP